MRKILELDTKILWKIKHKREFKKNVNKEKANDFVNGE